MTHAMSRANEASGFTLIELLIVVAIIGTIASLAAPGLLRARMAAAESSAIGSLRTVSSAESTYSSSCGANGYAQSLQDLALPPSGSVAGFISPDLAVNGIVKSGYELNVGPDASASTVIAASRTCNGSSLDAVSSFFAEAHPTGLGVTGQRSFAIDTRNTMYFMNPGVTIAPGMAGASVLQ
ncbi:MAG TPA: type II secretion system protein [Vicinamibacterales bacterium]|nr:type II secretion system protein [Vicinamibacterales bacterium]